MIFTNLTLSYNSDSFIPILMMNLSFKSFSLHIKVHFYEGFIHVMNIFTFIQLLNDSNHSQYIYLDKYEHFLFIDGQ